VCVFVCVCGGGGGSRTRVTLLTPNVILTRSESTSITPPSARRDRTRWRGSTVMMSLVVVAVVALADVVVTAVALSC
jgi:hypothetical protein